MNYASIDIGSNTVLLLIATVDVQGRIKPLIEKYEITRLGEKLDDTGELQPEAMRRTLKALLKFTDLCHRNQVSRIFCVGTEALRRAQNSQYFKKKVERHCGFRLEIIPGTKEAELAYLSAAVDFQETYPNLVVLDIGGGSTELVWQKQNAQGVAQLQTVSMKMGSVRLTEKFIHHDPPSAEEYEALNQAIDEVLTKSLVPLQLPHSPFHLIGIAGTVTTLLAIDQKISPYDPSKIQGGLLKISSLDPLIKSMRSMTKAEKEQMIGMEPKRADVLLAGAIILQKITQRLNVSEVIVSDRGIRYGLLYERIVER